MALSGSNEDTFKFLCNKAKTWAANMNAGHLSPSLTWQAATMKNLEYLIPALTLSLGQCNKIMTIVKSSQSQIQPKSNNQKHPNINFILSETRRRVWT